MLTIQHSHIGLPSGILKTSLGHCPLFYQVTLFRSNISSLYMIVRSIKNFCPVNVLTSSFQTLYNVIDLLTCINYNEQYYACFLFESAT